MPVKISNFRNGTSKKTILYYFHFLCCESIIDRVSITGVSITGNKSCKHCFFVNVQPSMAESARQINMCIVFFIDSNCHLFIVYEYKEVGKSQCITSIGTGFP